MLAKKTPNAIVKSPINELKNKIPVFVDENQITDATRARVRIVGMRFNTKVLFCCGSITISFGGYDTQ